MIKYVILGILAVIALIIAVMVIRACKAKAPEVKAKTEKAYTPEEEA